MRVLECLNIESAIAIHLDQIVLHDFENMFTQCDQRRIGLMRIGQMTSCERMTNNRNLKTVCSNTEMGLKRTPIEVIKDKKLKQQTLKTCCLKSV